MRLRNLCHVRPWLSPEPRPRPDSAHDPRCVRLTGWLDKRPVSLVVIWEPGERKAAKARPAYRSLLEITKAAVREQHPQLTGIPEHEHGDLFCFAWSNCFRFIVGSAMVERARAQLRRDTEPVEED